MDLIKEAAKRFRVLREGPLNVRGNGTDANRVPLRALAAHLSATGDQVHALAEMAIKGL